MFGFVKQWGPVALCPILADGLPLSPEWISPRETARINAKEALTSFNDYFYPLEVCHAGCPFVKLMFLLTFVRFFIILQSLRLDFYQMPFDAAVILRGMDGFVSNFFCGRKLLRSKSARGQAIFFSVLIVFSGIS